MRADVRRLAAARGLRVSWPVDRSPWWEVSHLAYLAAASEGKGTEFISRVYRARWQEGRDISDRAIIAMLAAEVGLNAEAAASAVDDEPVRRLGAGALLDLYRDGVFGVPFFVSRAGKFWGVDRLAAFLESIGRPAGELDTEDAEHAFTLTANRSGDQGHAGGCG